MHFLLTRCKFFLGKGACNPQIIYVLTRFKPNRGLKLSILGRKLQNFLGQGDMKPPKSYL